MSFEYKTSESQREASAKYRAKISADEKLSRRRRLKKYRADGILYISQTQSRKNALEFLTQVWEIYERRFPEK